MHSKILVEVDRIEGEEYLAELIDRYQNLIFSICYKMTTDYYIAEDLTQETFLSAFRNRSSFQGGNEKAWICRIATNKCIDYQKQAGRKVIPTEDISLECKQDVSATPETLYIENEVRAKLLKECKRLKPPYDEVATLYFYEEKNPEEISVVLKRNRKTVQTQIYRAREMLRKVYGKERE